MSFDRGLKEDMTVALKIRGKTPYTQVREEDLVKAVADHDRFRFEGVTATAATTAGNFAADLIIPVRDSAGTVIAYIPGKAAVW